MHPSLLILLVGLLFILGFDALSLIRRQGVSTRFAVEGLIVTAVFAAISLVRPISFLVFLIVIYFITMRVRLLVDLGSWHTSKNRFSQALRVFALALRLGPDDASRQLVLINRGVCELRMGEPETALASLREAMDEEKLGLGAKFLAAGKYNLGLACRRTGREAEAIRHFNDAIDALPSSIYAHGARQALKEGKASKAQDPSAQE